MPLDAPWSQCTQQQGSSETGLAARYALNVFFNLQNKTIFNYFPYPWTVSAVHVVVGLLYCTVSYFLGFRKASFGRVCPLHVTSYSL